MDLKKFLIIAWQKISAISVGNERIGIGSIEVVHEGCGGHGRLGIHRKI
jgi:hypothetical protein